MRITQLTISGFRGIELGSIVLSDFSVLIGANNAGKTTIIEALSLLLGRDRMVRQLTEHDFFGSSPDRSSRILITATITGFAGKEPQQHTDWFRAGRGVPKWWNPATRVLKAQQESEDDVLACQIAFSARFDLDTLEAEGVRYFYDDNAQIDPFDESASVTPLPASLIRDVGFFLVPANRTWDRMISFGSELFRRVVNYAGGKPSEAVLAERDRLRNPDAPLEGDAKLSTLVAEVNADIENLFGRASKLKLRLTSTDSEGVLEAVVPHFANDDHIPLPSRRHGTGLVSLQTIILLMRFGHLRVAKGENFLMAIEEPELHISPSQQRKLLHLMKSLATQTIITSHSPAVAAVVAPHELTLISNLQGKLKAHSLLDKPLDPSATNSQRGLFLSGRETTINALMHPHVIVPEGKLDARWFRLLARIADLARSAEEQGGSDFTHEVGVIPTVDSKVIDTFKLLQPVHPSVTCLVDGDAQGKTYTAQLGRLPTPPAAIIRWPDDWDIERVVTWIIEADPSILSDEQVVAAGIPTTIDALKTALSQKPLKDDEVSHEILADIISNSPRCQKRVLHILRVIGNICANAPEIAADATCHDLENTTAKLWILNHAISGI